MKNIANKLSNEEYEKNFAELRPPLTKNSAVAEANRCLYCYDSPCMKACPTHIDVSTFIKKIATDNLLGSARTIFKSNWVPLTCAKACPVEELCEGACVYVEKGEKPIEIGRLQRFVIEDYFNSDMLQLFTQENKNGKSVGVIGSGPSGLACGAELSLLGYDVKIYEANEIPGGLNTWGIAPYKLRRADSLKEVEYIKNLGVEISTGVRVGDTISFEEICNKHDAVFVGIGLGDATRLKVPGEELTGVVDALDFIEKVKNEKWVDVNVGKRVAVIGAGNTSIDVVTEAKRLGAEQVYIIYRRGIDDMSAYDFEYELAKSDEVIFHFKTMPKKIIGEKFVEGIECVKIELGERNEKGKREINVVPNSEFILPVDMVIKAVGQNINNNFLNDVEGIKIENGKVVVDTETYQTGNNKVFAGGDCINGGKEVVNAAYDGKIAAQGIDKYLENE
ncbi:MAG TPA: NAD(P)-dependent oxidoreductase [Ignavibacteria bacterium]|nr:NAD(P)-dependent oxidoreductase [Ignavibacteria bacterium]